MMEQDYNPSLSGAKAAQNDNKKSGNDLTLWQRLKAFFGLKQTKKVVGVVFLLTGIFLLFSFISFFFSGDVDQNVVHNNTVIENARHPGVVQNFGAALGAKISDFFIADGVGIAAFFVVIWCFVIGWRLIKQSKAHFMRSTAVTVFSVFACSMIVGAFTYKIDWPFFPLGGAFGKQANLFLEGLVQLYGVIAINFVIAMIWFYVENKSLTAIWNETRKRTSKLREVRKNKEEEQTGDDEDTFLGNSHCREEKSDTALTVPDVKQERKPRKSRLPKDDTQPTIETGEAVQMKQIEQSRTITNPGDPTGEYIHYVFPSLDLLPDIKMKTDSVDVEEQESNKIRIKETLANYGIAIKDELTKVHVGPTVTLFEIVPEDGVRIARIKNLVDDIALSLSALGIRIIAPMPGRGTIGIEVPNREPQVVPMRTVLGSDRFQNSKQQLPMVLGSTVSNEVFVADLTKMPHLLVAGATGQGKSVGLNAIIASLLYKKGPSELKLLLVDPKKVEFSLYADLDKYFFAHVPNVDRSIINDPKDVVVAMNSLVQEMENRYMVLEEVRERNIVDYNNKWRRELRKVTDEKGDFKYKFMPYIVVIIDEFADLIMQSGKEVETPIVRIAQKARAVGIHMIIATQRPDVKVITGLIKANFPGRIAFRVSQMVDSRTIIDQSGAQHLIGRGDMLFSANGEMTRLQCPFIDTPEVEKVCAFIAEQERNDKDVNHEKLFMLPEYTGPVSDGEGGDGGGAGANIGDRDPLFNEVARLVVQSDMASTSSLQRRYNIGYNRAGRLMDQLEAAGIVGPATGGKPRKVLVSPIELEDMLG